MHEYDETGRLVRSVTTREPEWSEQDTAEILALAEYRATRCPCGCGSDYRDSTGNEDQVDVVLAEPSVCLVRERLVAAMDKAAKGDYGIDARALLFHAKAIRRR